MSGVDCPRATFYPCRHQAGHHIPHAREALGRNPCYQRAPSLRTVARRRPAAISGALTFKAHDASFSAMGDNVLCLPTDGFELRPLRDQPVPFPHAALQHLLEHEA